MNRLAKTFHFFTLPAIAIGYYKITFFIYLDKLFLVALK